MVRIAVLLLVFALAGCLGGDAPKPPDPEPDPGPTPPTDPGETPVRPPRVIPMLLDYTFIGCDGVEIPLQLDHATAQAALPGGYNATATTDALGNTVATAVYAMFGCAALQTPSVAVNDTVYGFVAVQVDGDVGRETFYTLRMMANEGTMEALWTAAGYDVYVGAYARDDPTDTGRLADLSVGDYVFLGPAEGDEEITITDRRFDTEVLGGQLTWNLTGGSTRGRPVHGQLAVPSDDPFADAVDGTVLSSGTFWQDVQWGPSRLWLTPS